MTVIELTDTNKEAYIRIMHKVLDVANLSPDPSTQNSAVLCREALFGGVDVLTPTYAVNEFPRGVKYEDSRWERPIKYSYVEHAERNCIYIAAKKGIAALDTVMVSPWAACADCARAIIQSGIFKIVTLEPTERDTHERWHESVEIGNQMLDEAGVHRAYLSSPIGVTFWLRRDGKPFWP